MIYNQGVQDGAVTRWYSNGIKKFEGSYSGGNPTGLWKYYSESGSLIKEEQQ